MLFVQKNSSISVRFAVPTPIPTKEEIEAWDLAACLEYGREALHHFSGDREEILQRRNLLISSRFGDLSPVLREVVMLSLAAEDIATVRKVVGWLEEAGDPATGYYVHRAMVDRGDSHEGDEFLISAARRGHFPAQRVLLDRRARERGLFSPLFFLASRVAHAYRVYKVARRNPKDLRLK